MGEVEKGETDEKEEELDRNMWAPEEEEEEEEKDVRGCCYHGDGSVLL